MLVSLPRIATPECPCTGHCTTALGDDVCRSCHRTFEEVTRWPELTDEERILINQRIMDERRKLNSAPENLRQPGRHNSPP